MGIPSYTRNGGAGFHFHFIGGNPGRCHCIGNVVGYSYYMGGCADNAFCLHYAFHQLLQKDRAFHYRIRLGDRAVVYYELFLVDIDWPAATVGGSLRLSRKEVC